MKSQASLASPRIATSEHSQPWSPAGMHKINRFWDRKAGIWTAKILPGELYVSACGEMVVTVLGSCVAACIRDPERGIGGMNHFMLPEESEFGSGRFAELKTRYGNWAMEVLINEILKFGGDKKKLEVKLFGGGHVVNHMTTDVGQRNIQFVLNFLKNEGIQVTAEDVGGERPRKVYYATDTGQCRVRTLSRLNNETIMDREKSYSKKVSTGTDGSVELFDWPRGPKK